MSQLLGVYQPGHTALHRMPVGPKLGGLALWSVLVVALSVTGCASPSRERGELVREEPVTAVASRRDALTAGFGIHGYQHAPDAPAHPLAERDPSARRDACTRPKTSART